MKHYVQSDELGMLILSERNVLSDQENRQHFPESRQTATGPIPILRPERIGPLPLSVGKADNLRRVSGNEAMPLAILDFATRWMSMS